MDMLGVKTWIIPALAQVCQRTNPLTIEEAARLGYARLIKRANNARRVALDTRFQITRLGLVNQTVENKVMIFFRVF